MDEYTFAFDENGNVVTGHDLHFGYAGSGVATFVDKDGTGFRVPIGTRNLAEVDSDGKVWLERGSMVEDDLDALDPTTDPEQEPHEDLVFHVPPSEPTVAEMTIQELRTYLRRQNILFSRNMSAPKLRKLAEASGQMPGSSRDG